MSNVIGIFFLFHLIYIFNQIITVDMIKIEHYNHQNDMKN